jgi:hypothetical protein
MSADPPPPRERRFAAALYADSERLVSGVRKTGLILPIRIGGSQHRAVAQGRPAERVVAYRRSNSARTPALSVVAQSWVTAPP